MMKLNKYVAHAGVCSRRKAAELVKAGKVKVNGEIEVNPAYEVQADDKIEYKGRTLRPEKNMVYLLMNKPKNTITSMSDDRGRKTVMDIVGDKVKERIFPVGRLDYATTGLLLLTNDGHLAKKLSHPSHEVKKVYEVILDKEIPETDIDKIRTGLILEDGPVQVDAVAHLPEKDHKHASIELHIGRNRIVRRIFSHLGYEVVKLDRTYYAGLTKKDLPRGFFRPLSKQEVIMLKYFV